MPDEDYARTPDFYYAVAASLLAGDVQARVVANPENYSIEVRLVDGSRVFWSNNRDYWGFTHVEADGAATGDYETLPWDCDVEDAAKMIAMHDYPSPAEWPEDHPGVSG